MRRLSCSGIQFLRKGLVQLYRAVQVLGGAAGTSAAGTGAGTRTGAAAGAGALGRCISHGSGVASPGLPVGYDAAARCSRHARRHRV